ncbi:hypothetical protein BLS_008730 [Venturia inaequalis]|uniref:Uncharacterized protein n=1 Tax=Venturia inaequalis TaxID=5025 RepID=A0A8H3U5N7_VENIN|nr:hypothetical protein BLS_008730 [Venturia inaequalis]
MRFGNALIAIAALSSQLSIVLGRSITTDSTDLVKKAYTRPAIFDKTFAKGEKLIAAMMNPPNKDDLPESSLLYFKKFCKHEKKVEAPVDSGGSIKDDADLAAKKFGWDLKRPWNYNNWYIKEEEVQGEVSSTWFDDVSKTMIVEASFNEPLEELFKGKVPPIKNKELPFHSDIWTCTYGDMMATGQHLKYVMRNNIINAITEEMLRTARKLLAPDNKDAEVVEVNRDSDDIAEREAFIALAGTDNGSTLFRMITDRHDLFAYRKVTKVWLWGSNRGQCHKADYCLAMMVWELEEAPRPSRGCVGDVPGGPICQGS